MEKTILNPQDFVKQVTIDCVIFGFENGQLKVLISKINFKGPFHAIITGFIKNNEDVEKAADRVAFEGTGLKGIYLEQFKVFGKVDRQRREFIDELIQINNLESTAEINDYEWFTKRHISIGFYALLDINKVNLELTEIDESLTWYNIHEVPSLIMDNNEILTEAHKSLLDDINNKFTAFNLLPEKFTMRDVQDIYETIFEREYVRPNFQKKILQMDVLERLEKKFTGAANKAPYLYKIKNT